MPSYVPGGPSYSSVTRRACFRKRAAAACLHAAVVDGPGDLALEVLPADNPIDEAVFEEELAGLKTLG